jgi:hypothetical protein
MELPRRHQALYPHLKTPLSAGPISGVGPINKTKGEGCGGQSGHGVVILNATKKYVIFLYKKSHCRFILMESLL